MGQGKSRLSRGTPASGQRQFKLFEYQCPCCRAKRTIQYFHDKGRFVQQAPRVVCGVCHTSVMVEPFKTVDWSCPSCKKWQKARVPGRPIPLNMYNVSMVRCNCGFRGQVSVGKLMDVACGHCWARKMELHDIWAEDGDEVRMHCGQCRDYRRAFAFMPKKKRDHEPAGDFQFTCDQCSHVESVHAEDLLRSEGLACCSQCSWVGYPQVVPREQNGTAPPPPPASISSSTAPPPPPCLSTAPLLPAGVPADSSDASGTVRLLDNSRPSEGMPRVQNGVVKLPDTCRPSETKQQSEGAAVNHRAQQGLTGVLPNLARD
mmetsp:Transcript_49832/g.96227  ORF Transcript_49832/g.96227 Transcript_49832/m.96227 type:complete len:317 (-) Transcript_49832:294-1244(-)